MHVSIQALEVNETYTSVYILKSHSVKTNRNGGQYVDAILQDESGTIQARMWEVPESVKDMVDGGFIEVMFTVGQYNGVSQAVCSKMKPLTSDEVVDKTGIVPSAPISPKDMFWDLYHTVEAFQDEEYKRVVMRVLKENQNAMLTMPGAKSVHHAVIGGLLMHVHGMLNLAKAMSSVYPNINTDLLYAGVIMHDIGKLREFDKGPSGLVSDYTIEGNLEGHIFMGAQYVGNICRDENIDDEKRMLLEHMILSHHGEPEMGSSVRPLFLEAYLLHVIDDTDAKVYIFNDVLKNVNPGEMSDRIFALDRRIYKPKI